MKTIKATINYCLFCFSDIHSFNFNFTLTVLMFNLATKNLSLLAGSCKLGEHMRSQQARIRRQILPEISANLDVPGFSGGKKCTPRSTGA